MACAQNPARKPRPPKSDPGLPRSLKNGFPGLPDQRPEDAQTNHQDRGNVKCGDKFSHDYMVLVIRVGALALKRKATPTEVGALGWVILVPRSQAPSLSQVDVERSIIVIPTLTRIRRVKAAGSDRTVIKSPCARCVMTIPTTSHVPHVARDLLTAIRTNRCLIHLVHPLSCGR